MEKCLLVRIKGGHQYLVPEDTLSALPEFLKTFQAEVYRVKVLEGKVLSGLRALAKAICDQDYNPSLKVERLKKIYPVVGKRQATLQNAKKIKQHIEEKLLTGKSLSLRSLKKRFPNNSYACLCNHFSAVRKELVAQGHMVARVGQGVYCLSISPDC